VVKAIGLSVAAAVLTAAAATFELAAGDRRAALYVPPGEPECVVLAARDLAEDVRMVTGLAARIVSRRAECAPHCVIVASLAHSRTLIEELDPDLAAGLKGKWEAFRIRLLAGVGSARSTLLIAGSDERGAIFGVYAFSERYLGIDPLYFWTGFEPPRRGTLRWKHVSLEADEPTFRYRGWFINDEDLLTEWRDGGGRRFIDYPYYHQVIHPEVMERVLEAALRLGFNLIIPSSFNDITNPPEEGLIRLAVRRGLHVSMHHVEPVGVSAFAFSNYWRRKGMSVPFAFHAQRAAFEEIWRHFAFRWAAYPGVVWQLGLRGIADRPFWHHDPEAPRTDEARAELISEAVQLQWRIVGEADSRPQPPATITLWMEGAEFNRRGLLRLPEAVTVVFADNTPGWKMQADFYQSPRQPGRTYGIYYHHALWSSGPHLVQAAPPWKTCEILEEAVKRQANYYALFNVANVREFVLGLEATAHMVRDLRRYEPYQWFRRWVQTRFPEAAREAERAYRDFFAAYEIDEQTGTPALLDGQTLAEGRRLLGRILKPEASITTPPTPRSEPLNRFFPSMRPVGSWTVPELIERCRRQRLRMESALRWAASAANRLKGYRREFLENNLLAQARILTGLLAWTESLAAASEQRERDPEAAAACLTQALEAFRQIREAQALAGRGRWRDWYRGDRKMNLDGAESQTRQALDLLQRGILSRHE